MPDLSLLQAAADGQGQGRLRGGCGGGRLQQVGNSGLLRLQDAADVAQEGSPILHTEMPLSLKSPSHATHSMQKQVNALEHIASCLS